MPKRSKLRYDDFPDLHTYHRERMRKRILQNGAASLEPYELLETLLYIPVPRRNTNHTAHMLVDRFGGVEQVLQLPVDELMRIPGVGGESARFLGDIGRVVEAYARSKRQRRPALDNSAAARRSALEFFAENTDAGCVLLSLDEAMRLLAASALPRSPSTQELILAGVKFRAAKAVVALRSGDAVGAPLHSEKQTFRTLSLAFSLLNICFVDFLVVGDGGGYSYLERLNNAGTASYDADERLHRSSLHFDGSRAPMRFACLLSGENGGENAAFASADDAVLDDDILADVPPDDAFSDAEIDPEEICETVVEPLGTVGRLNEAEADSVLGAAPFGELFAGEEADEKPF